MSELLKIIGLWLGNPVRAMATMVIALLMAWSVVSVYPGLMFAFIDPVWRWPAGLFFIALAGLTTYPLEFTWRAISARSARRSERRLVSDRLRKLTQNEKYVLSQFLAEDTRTRTFGREGGAADGLARDGILHRADRAPAPVGGIAMDLYFIDEAVWDHLHKYPEIVGLVPNPQNAE